MVRWKEAAADNPLLTAAELYFMAHPNERVPWRRFLSSPPPPPHRWGRRKPRSSSKPSPLTVEEEKAPGRASPTTPLSWNPCDFAPRLAAPAGSGKMVTELKECERSLLEKNMFLRKRLEEQRTTQEFLAKENKRLKSLESKLHHPPPVTETNAVSKGAEESKREECRCLPFDLNLPCPTELDEDINHNMSCS